MGEHLSRVEEQCVCGALKLNKDDAEYLAATLYLETILEDGELRCKFIEKDIDGASIMHCEVDGHDVASMMVQMGMAQDYLRQSNGYYKPEPSEW